MKVAKNFSLKEMTASQTAERMGIDNTPNTDQLLSLAVLANRVLQPCRDKFGVVTLTSTLRVPDLNKAIGGSETSSHCKGEASDFEIFSSDNLVVAQWIAGNLEFDQLILEFYKKGDPHSGWIHCSYRRGGDNRNQVLTALKGEDGKVSYQEGLADG